MEEEESSDLALLEIEKMGTILASLHNSITSQVAILGTTPLASNSQRNAVPVMRLLDILESQHETMDRWSKYFLEFQKTLRN
ncbi:hypothetical protein DSO57_1032063 [Entomophthora muscae]|uniref:Uncharacterized protein n=1 Tax=Entomophthora muscae TaxID=34485 RepID=A0ACC2TYX7_9FUNG|nr:hypothetical protein DSO57_1032063 [Entomophthora muscae]